MTTEKGETFLVLAVLLLVNNDSADFWLAENSWPAAGAVSQGRFFRVFFRDAPLRWKTLTEEGWTRIVWWLAGTLFAFYGQVIEVFDLLSGIPWSYFIYFGTVHQSGC